jgi:hypothetical protein
MKKAFQKQLFYISLSFLLTGFANAQVNFKDGLVVLKNGDTIKGQIDYRNWEVNPTKVRFKNSLSDSLYSAQQLLSFEITGEDKYQSALISKDMRPIDITGINIMGDDEMLVTDTAFLRVVVMGGNVSLFELIDHKRHFYIQENFNSKPEELIYKKYMNEDKTHISEKAIFRNQLNRLANSYKVAGLDSKIERCGYTLKELRAIIRVINGEDINSATETEKKKKEPLQVMIGGGAQYYSFSFGGNNDKYTRFQFQNEIAPVVSAALDVFGGRNAQKLAIRFQLSYTQMKYDGTYEATTTLLRRTQKFSYQIKQNNITPQVAVLYHFVNQKKFRLYGGISMAFTFSSYPTNVYNEYTVETGRNETIYNDLQMEKTWVHSDIIVGGRLNNKVNLSLSTKLIGGFINYYNVSSKLFPLALTASYIFVNRKGNNK